MLAGREAVPLPIIPEAPGEPLKRKLYVLLGDEQQSYCNSLGNVHATNASIVGER